MISEKTQSEYIIQILEIDSSHYMYDISILHNVRLNLSTNPSHFGLYSAMLNLFILN
jgi:hypothetical protein